MENSNYYQNIRPEMREFLPKNYRTVLEIGCGEGNFSANLKPGCEVWGLELNKDVAQEAKNKLHTVICGKFEDSYSELPDNYFDLVICNDVIEHMIDHEWFFSTIKTKLKKDAFLIGSIPNVRYYNNLKDILYNKDWEYTAEGILDTTHLRFFTEKSLKRSLTDHTFYINKFTGINKLNYKRYGRRRYIHRAIAKTIIFLSFGFHKDIEYLQFAFSAKNTSHSNKGS